MRKIEKWRLQWIEVAAQEPDKDGHDRLQHPGWTNLEAMGLTPEQDAERSAFHVRTHTGLKVWRLWNIDGELPQVMFKKHYESGSIRRFCQKYRVAAHTGSGDRWQQYCHAYLNRKQVQALLWEFR